MTGFMPTHLPAWQASVWVQKSPSLQPVPSALLGFEQAPFAGSHVPASWHWSCAVHTTGIVPVQAPAAQTSFCVQAFPSLHVVPSAFAGFEHAPLAGSHVPASWHWSCAVHTTGIVPVHAPAWQTSLCVQAFPSLQVVPSAFAGFEHTPLAGSHVPAS